MLVSSQSVHGEDKKITEYVCREYKNRVDAKQSIETLQPDEVCTNPS